MEKKTLILYENNHYIASYKKNFFHLNTYVSFYHNISVFNHLSEKLNCNVPEIELKIMI